MEQKLGFLEDPFSRFKISGVTRNKVTGEYPGEYFSSSF